MPGSFSRHGGWDAPPAYGPGDDAVFNSVTTKDRNSISPYTPVAAAGTISASGIQDVNGKNLLTFGAVVSAVDYLELDNAAAGGIPTFYSRGSDSFIGMNFAAKGGSTTIPQFGFYGNGGVDQVFVLVNNYTGGAANQTNYFEMDNGTAGVAPLLTLQGVDANISMSFKTKGTGGFNFQTIVAGGGTLFQIAGAAASAIVNYVQVQGAATGGIPTISSQGTDAFVALNFSTVGGSAGIAAYSFYGNGGVDQIVVFVDNYVGAGINQTNYWELDNSVLGATPLLQIQGGDTNVGMALRTKGTGEYIFQTSLAGLGTMFQVGGALANTVNSLRVTGNTAGNAPQILAQGTDANVGISITPKAAAGVTISANNATQLYLDTAGNAAQAATIQFNKNAVAEWQLGQPGDATFRLWDLVNGRANFIVDPTTGWTFQRSVGVSMDLKRSRQTPTEAVLVSGVTATTGEIVSVTITAARVVGAPLSPATGQRLTFQLLQSGAGAFAITWNAAFKGITGGTSGATGTRASFGFYYDGTNWILDGAQPTWVA